MLDSFTNCSQFSYVKNQIGRRITGNSYLGLKIQMDTQGTSQNLNKSSARWDEFAKLKFVELCEEEISKGNRPRTYLSKDGWDNLVRRFKIMTGRSYNKKQMRNHWDSIKLEWCLFKDLMRGQSEIGWDEARKTIVADDKWWEERIQVNEKFKRFRNRDLSLICRYDVLFSDVVDTGARSRTPNGRFYVGGPKKEAVYDEVEGSGNNDECLKLIVAGQSRENPENYMLPAAGQSRENPENSTLPEAGQSLENHENIIFPVVGQSRENRDNYMLPSSSFAKRKSSIRSETRKSRASSLRDDIENLVNLISTKISGTGPSIEECLGLLGKIEGLVVGSPTYFYACNFLCNKENREMFIAIGDDTARYNWIMYNYNISKSNNPGLP
ncbi:hypothetical protein Adt_20077 [Abeliophyllum distichum]|uniref:Myb/SANT-like domain-containing protein n=1 Tax=Abeliophyllum distichum TaxID=126358 RepID=A0ABD1SUR3_9LAMI